MVTILRGLLSAIVFVFDEFDQILDRGVAQSFSETIKALSDYSVPSTVVVVGVGDNVDSLIEAHASVERALVQIKMPRMDLTESREIIAKATERLGFTCHPSAENRIVRLAQGLPHYVHLLGLYAVRHALAEDRRSIEPGDVDAGIELALEKVSQTTTDAYLRATNSPQKETLFKEVLLACALAETDEMGYFAPAAVRAPLASIGRALEIPSFASHLNKFSSADRGEILRKKGTNRKFRYRFRNPILQPYVVMRGVSEGLIKIEDVEITLSEAEAESSKPNKRRDSNLPRSKNRR